MASSILAMLPGLFSMGKGQEMPSGQKEGLMKGALSAGTGIFSSLGNVLGNVLKDVGESTGDYSPKDFGKSLARSVSRQLIGGDVTDNQREKEDAINKAVKQMNGDVLNKNMADKYKQEDVKYQANLNAGNVDDAILKPLRQVRPKKKSKKIYKPKNTKSLRKRR